MNVLVIEPGNGSRWLSHAYFVDRFGNPNARGKFVAGDVWAGDGGWNMPDDYQGQWEAYMTHRRFILKVERAAMKAPAEVTA